MTPYRSAPRLRDYPNRNNSLNFLRLVLALVVIISHAWPIGGFGGSPSVGGVPLGTVAVAGFFGISGWLITRSRLCSELPSYAWRRLLRIYPAYLVALVVVAWIAAPLGSVLRAGAWSARNALHYVLVNATLHVHDFSVGGTPRRVPYPGAWNGSLWTLYYEAGCYLAVGLLLTVVGRRWFTPAVIVAWIGTTVLRLAEQNLHLHTRYDVDTFLQLAPYFFAGAALYVLRARVRMHAAVAGVCAVWLSVVGFLRCDPVIAALPLAYLLLWLGAVLPLRAVGRRNDVSYGMYIYAFPVQQLLVLLGANRWGVAPYVVLSAVATAPIALLSWVLVERPAQRLRHAADRFPLVRSGLAIRRRPAPASNSVATAG